MTHLDFTSLSIQFAQTDKASVYYAHLQNLFKQLYLDHLQKSYQKQQLILQKINKVLYDVYFQHLKLQKSYFQTSTNLKTMLQDCTAMVNQCKTDRQQLVKVTEDRQAILQKLKLSTNQTLQMVQQNQQLYQQLNKFKQINILLQQKNNVLEEQIMNVTTTNKGYENVVTISKQVQRISNDNLSIQNDIVDILKSTEIYANASEPLQIMCLAFQQNPNLRQQLWDKIVNKHQNKFDNIQNTKSNFFNFNYIDALMLFSK